MSNLDPKSDEFQKWFKTHHTSEEELEKQRTESILHTYMPTTMIWWQTKHPEWTKEQCNTAIKDFSDWYYNYSAQNNKKSFIPTSIPH